MYMKNTFIRITVETVYMKNTFISIIIATLYMKNTMNTSLLLMFLCFLFCTYHSAFTPVHCMMCNLITIYLMTFLHLALILELS